MIVALIDGFLLKYTKFGVSLAFSNSKSAEVTLFSLCFSNSSFVIFEVSIESFKICFYLTASTKYGSTKLRSTAKQFPSSSSKSES